MRASTCPGRRRRGGRRRRRRWRRSSPRRRAPWRGASRPSEYTTAASHGRCIVSASELCPFCDRDVLVLGDLYKLALALAASAQQWACKISAAAEARECSLSVWCCCTRRQ